MKIAVIVSHFPQLTETFILNRISGLIDLGHDVDIYAYEPGPARTVHPDVARYRLLERTRYFDIPRNRFLRVLKAPGLFLGRLSENPSLLLRSLNAVKYGREALSLRLFYGALPFIGRSYDVVHSHHGPNGLKDTWLKELGAFRGKHLTSFHGADATRHVQIYGPRVYDRLFDKGDLFLPVSQGMKKRLVALGCDERKIIVHPSGIDLERFSFGERRYAPGETLRIVTVGRLVEKKGLAYAIGAVARVSQRGIGAEYRVVGSGELEGHLRDLARASGVGDHVHFLGEKTQDEVHAILASSHVMLVPSVRARDGNLEGIPNAIKEAMATGIPVVATRHGDIPEIVEEGRTGFLVEEAEVEGLASRIRWVVEHPMEVKEICLRARALVEDQYDIAKLNKRLVEIYRSLVDEGRLKALAPIPS